MKILHIGICVYPKPIWLQKSLNKVAECKDIRPEEPDHKILKAFLDFKPDLVFIQVQSVGTINISTVREMSKTSLVINWMGDVRNNTEKWFIDWSPYVINCFSNMRDVAKVPRSEYLQIGIDPEIFKDYKKEKNTDIVFMANRYGNFPLSRYRANIVKTLKHRFNSRVKILGNGWPQADGNLNGNQKAESVFYSHTKIGISLSHFDLDRYFSDRLIRIMASGCFALSHRYKGMENDFEIGKHLEVFDSENDMINKINHYLVNETQREEIARQGCEYVHENFTTDNMVQHILEIYNKHK